MLGIWPNTPRFSEKKMGELGATFDLTPGDYCCVCCRILWIPVIFSEKLLDVYISLKKDLFYREIT